MEILIDIIHIYIEQYKAYILTETGSGIPAFPYLPQGPDFSINGGFLATTQSIIGNEDPNIMSTSRVSGSFEIFDASRGIHPFVFTTYSQLVDPPAAGSLIAIYKMDRHNGFYRSRI